MGFGHGISMNWAILWLLGSLSLLVSHNASEHPRSLIQSMIRLQVISLRRSQRDIVQYSAHFLSAPMRPMRRMMSMLLPFQLILQLASRNGPSKSAK